MNKKILFLYFFCLFAGLFSKAQSGNSFSSITSLQPVNIKTNTTDKPQSKVWKYAGNWWTVLATFNGTIIHRLSGNQWVEALNINSAGNTRADVWVTGDLVHILLYRGTGNAGYLVSVRYDANTGNYKLWESRPAPTTVNFGSGVETAVLSVDDAGRMWIAYADVNEVRVCWSDAPYSAISAPVVLANDINDDDICTLAKLPGKMGVIWSNQNTKRFGFRTHTDGQDPGIWSADEVPASQSASSTKSGMADDHLNVTVTTDGTLYCAVKTASNVPQIALLVRRPNGAWDDMYPVASNIGTTPVVAVNESQAKVLVFYTTADGGGDIVFCESPLSSIAFGGPQPFLMRAAGEQLYYPSVSHYPLDQDLVLVATKTSTAFTGMQAAGVLALSSVSPPADTTRPSVVSLLRQFPLSDTTSGSSLTWRVTFSEPVTGLDKNDFVLSRLDGTVAATLTDTSIQPIGLSSTVFDIKAITVTGTGTLRLDVLPGGWTDTASNAMFIIYSGGESYTIVSPVAEPPKDTTAPLVVSLLRQSPLSDSTSETSLTWRVTFSEPVTGLDKNDFVLSRLDGTAAAILTDTSIQATGTSATIFDIKAVAVTGTGTLRLDVLPGGWTDTANNVMPSGYTSGQTYYIKPATIPLTVTGIRRQSPMQESVLANTVVYRVSFSKKVTGVTAGDFELVAVSGNIRGTLAKISEEAISSIAPESITQVGNDGTTYDVSVRALSGQGNLRLDLKPAGTSIKDTDGNLLASGYNLGELYNINAVSSYGFQSISDINPLLVNAPTRESPQSKVWGYDGYWWTVQATSAGTKLYRLNGNTWVEVLKLDNANNSRSDCKVAGDLAHVLLFRGTSSDSYLVSLQYDNVQKTYKFWSLRPKRAAIRFEKGALTATLEMDSRGRMWIASNGAGTVNVRWSNSPYSTWSAPFTIATGLSTSDFTAVTALPGKIGVFWSNQITKRYGFKTHEDGADPMTWSTDEVPAGASALSIGGGMADAAFNLSTASDGTLYCASRTKYSTAGYPSIILLVRRNTGTWDGVYTVTSSSEGNKPFVVLNEAQGKLKVLYNSSITNDDGSRTAAILYRESPTGSIAFGAPRTIMGYSGKYIQYSSSVHHTYNSDLVIIATNENTNPNEMVSVLVSDGSTGTISQQAQLPSAPTETLRASNNGESPRTNSFSLYPNPAKDLAMAEFVLASPGFYSIYVFDMNGRMLAVMKQGFAEAGQTNRVQLNSSTLRKGVYVVQLRANGKIFSKNLVISE